MLGLVGRVANRMNIESRGTVAGVVILGDVVEEVSTVRGTFDRGIFGLEDSVGS